MKNLILFGVIIIMNSCKQNTKIPVPEKIPKEMTMHGHKRIDNYYWMRLSDEQKTFKQMDNQTERVLEYIKRENNYTNQNLYNTKNLQKKIFDEIVSRIKKDDNTVPYFQNGYYYYTKYKKNKEYAIYCRKKGTLDASEEIMIDANKLSRDYDYFSIGGRYVSPDNKWLAYSADTLGRRIYSIYFKNLETKQTLEYSIPQASSSIAWANDSKTIFYSRQNQISLNPDKIFRHKLNSNIVNDYLVYEEEDAEYWSGVYRSKSGQYIIIYNQGHSSSDYHFLNADRPNGNFTNFSIRKDNHKYSILHFQDKFYVLTDLDAPNNRLMETSIYNTKSSNWREIIPHREKEQILEIDVFINHLVLNERRNGLSMLRIIEQNSMSDYYIEFNEESYFSYISTNKEFETNVLRFGYTSMVTPYSTFDYDMKTREKTLLKRQEIVGGYNENEYHTERINAKSRDGQKIPISLVYRKDQKKATAQNLLLYGYGSYGSTTDPYFSSTRLSLLDRGFIFAIANIRGGQVFGKQSYENGKLLNKKNTFNDFIDAGKFLINENYSDPEHLFCYGGSAGGLLIGAVINMEPDMWKGAIAGVPFVDVVTTMLDSTIPLTTYEWVEWGDPRDKEYYDYMLSYSPYDQITLQEYPNLLITAGFFDSQVQYWEPLKWIAKLREYWDGDNKLFLHMNMDAGHSGKSGRFRRYKEYALEYAFLFNLAGIDY